MSSFILTHPLPFEYLPKPSQSENRTDIQGLNGQITMGGVHVQSSSSSPSSSSSLFLFWPRSSSVNTTQKDQKFHLLLLSRCLPAFNSRVVQTPHLFTYLNLPHHLPRRHLTLLPPLPKGVRKRHKLTPCTCICKQKRNFFIFPH